MKKPEAQLANKVAKHYEYTIERVKVPGEHSLFTRMNGLDTVLIAKGTIQKQRVDMITWSSKELELSGYAGHPVLKRNEHVEIPVPCNILRSRKEIKAIVRNEGEAGIKRLLTETLAFRKTKRVG